jgi:hypothetical protein
MIWVLMMSPILSQNISKGEIKTIINENNDTLIIMTLEDGKKILTDLLECEITDSILDEYVLRDSLNTEKIILKEEMITRLIGKNGNYEQVISNMELIINNKDSEIVIKDNNIKDLKKEVRKQKRQKVIAIITSITLPILVALIILL